MNIPLIGSKLSIMHSNYILPKWQLSFLICRRLMFLLNKHLKHFLTVRVRHHFECRVIDIMHKYTFTRHKHNLFRSFRFVHHEMIEDEQKNCINYAFKTI